MPVLMVSEKTWPHARLLQEALDAAFLVGDDDPELERVRRPTSGPAWPARRCSRWKATISDRSKSHSASPEITMNVSSSSSCGVLDRAGGPQRDSSTEYSRRTPSDEPSPR